MSSTKDCSLTFSREGKALRRRWWLESGPCGDEKVASGLPRATEASLHTCLMRGPLETPGGVGWWSAGEDGRRISCFIPAMVRCVWT